MRRLMFALALLIGAAILLSVPAAAERPGPGAFLKYRVDNVGALVTEITNEPRVAERYAQHFGVTRAHLKEYLEKYVHLTTLRKPTQTEVYFTAKGGGIAHEKRLLPAGTKVFATEQGDLVLEWRCGNPLAARLPVVMSKPMQPTMKPHTTTTGQSVAGAQPTPATNNPTTNAVVAPSTTVETPAPVTTTTQGTGQEVVQNPNPKVSVLPSVETLPPGATTPIVPTTAPPAVATTATPPIAAAPTVTSGGGKGFPWVLPLLLGAGAGLAGGGGGGSTPAPAPVPEPTTIVMFATGLVGCGMKVVTRRK